MKLFAIISPARRITCLGAASLALIAPSVSHAQAQPSVTKICTAEAGNAKTIAQARDSGISKSDELQEIDRVAESMPPERQAFAQAELRTFVDRLYGKYSQMPPPEVYTKYLAYCLQRSGHVITQ